MSRCSEDCRQDYCHDQGSSSGSHWSAGRRPPQELTSAPACGHSVHTSQGAARTNLAPCLNLQMCLLRWRRQHPQVRRRHLEPRSQQRKALVSSLQRGMCKGNQDGETLVGLQTTQVRRWNSHIMELSHHDGMVTLSGSVVVGRARVAVAKVGLLASAPHCSNKSSSQLSTQQRGWHHSWWLRTERMQYKEQAGSSSGTHVGVVGRITHHVAKHLTPGTRRDTSGCMAHRPSPRSQVCHGARSSWPHRTAHCPACCRAESCWLRSRSRCPSGRTCVVARKGLRRAQPLAMVRAG
jgi:hypothetical protein